MFFCFFCQNRFLGYFSFFTGKHLPWSFLFINWKTNFTNDDFETVNTMIGRVVLCRILWKMDKTEHMPFRKRKPTAPNKKNIKKFESSSKKNCYFWHKESWFNQDVFWDDIYLHNIHLQKQLKWQFNSVFVYRIVVLIGLFLECLPSVNYHTR